MFIAVIILTIEFRICNLYSFDFVRVCCVFKLNYRYSYRYRYNEPLIHHELTE